MVFFSVSVSFSWPAVVEAGLGAGLMSPGSDLMSGVAGAGVAGVWGLPGVAGEGSGARLALSIH